MIPTLTARILTSVAPNCLWKAGWNLGVKGVISVERFKARKRKGIVFPPFLHLSIINSCNLTCQGCWVDVTAPRQMMSLETLDAIVSDAKAHGNVFFGILGGDRGLLHQGIHQKIADLNIVAGVDLTVIDAYRILRRHGPTGGNLQDVETPRKIALCADPVAADAFGATLFGIPPDQIGYIRASAEAGLGTMDLAELEVKEIAV